jgi:hypothetical protein
MRGGELTPRESALSAMYALTFTRSMVRKWGVSVFGKME